MVAGCEEQLLAESGGKSRPVAEGVVVAQNVAADRDDFVSARCVLYSTEAIGLALEFVNLNIAPPKKKLKREERPKKKAEEPVIPDDITGEQTLALLREVRKTTRRMAGKELQSLGLHSAVYFYSSTGRFQPSAFLATASLIRELEEQKQFLWFTVHRSKFEDFLARHRYLVNQMVIKHGSMEKSHEPMLDMYRTALALASENKTNQEILDALIAKFPHLRKQEAREFLTTNAELSGGMKNAAVRRAGLSKVHCCHLCMAPIHPNAVSWGHEIDIKHGGTGNLDNVDPAHPYCNGAKDKLLPMFALEPPRAWQS